MRCHCGQEDWETEARALTSAGLDERGRMHRVGIPCDPPTTPRAGLPHLKVIEGKWCVVIGKDGVWHSLAAMALKHAKLLNTMPPS